MKMKYLIVLLCLLCWGCTQTIADKTTKLKEVVVTKPIFLKGQAYIYFCKNYEGLSRHWYWIYLAEESGWSEDKRCPIAKILLKGDKFTLVEFYSTPCPGGKMVEIIIPNKLIHYYELNIKIKAKIESMKSEQYENHFNFTSDQLTPNIQKVKQYGELVDVYFGLIKTKREAL